MKRERKIAGLGISTIFQGYQTCRFDDINLFRLMGKDTVHLEHVILSNHDNVIILRKLVGTTRIIVPVDVEVQS